MSKKSIFSTFFEVTEKDPIDRIGKELEKKPASTPTINPIVNETIVNSPTTTFNGYTGKFDEVLDSIIEKENLPGPDVYELIMSVKELQASGLSEDQAYRSSFTAFKSMGLTKEKLITTANHYIDVITKVYNDFQTNVIGKKQIEVDEVNQHRNDLLKQIEELTLKVNELSTQHKSLNEELIINKQEIEGSYNKTTTHFKNIILKIQNYL